MALMYLGYPNLFSAQNRNRSILTALRGREKLVGEVSEYLFAFSINENTGKTSLVVPEDQINLLTQGEQSQLKTEAEAEAAEEKAVLKFPI